jgi:hypothetical protein
MMARLDVSRLSEGTIAPTKVITNNLGEEVRVYTSGPLAGRDASGNVVIEQAEQVFQPFKTGPVTPVNPVVPVNPVDPVEDLLARQEAARIAEANRRDRQSAYDILYNEFNKYGLGS